MRQGMIHIYCGDGKGKTTTSVGVSQALNKLGKKTICALREIGRASCRERV